MDNILKTPEHITSLATGGILLRAKVRVWTATKQDRDISDEITQAKNADSRAGRYTKQLFANVPELKALLNNRQAWYNFVQRVTYPWDGEWGYLPTVRIASTMEEIEKRKVETETLIEQFINVMPQAIANEAFAQGQMFNRDDYPTPDEVRSKFKVIVQTMNVPEGDYKVQISTHLAEDLQRNFEQQTRDIIADIHGKQNDQLIRVLQSLSHCCETETLIEDGKIKIKRKKVYESTLNEALELCNTFSKFNLTNDPRLDQVCAQLSGVLKDVNIEQLRINDSTRIVVKDGVDNILKKFGL